MQRSVFTIAWLLVSLTPVFAYAQACDEPPIARIGEVRYIKDDVVTLKGIVLFDDKQDLYSTFGSSYSFEAYRALAEQFARQDHTNFQPAPLDDPKFDQTLTLTHKTKVAPGDILVYGPPKHACDFGFLGVYNGQGVPRHYIIKADFMSFADPSIVTKPSRELSCSRQTCKVETDFTVEGEQFILGENDFYQPNTPLVNSVQLIRALKSQTQDWGASTYAHFVVDVEGTTSNSESEVGEKAEPESWWQRLLHFFSGLFGG